MRAYVEAYGCTLNFGEAREIEDLLSGSGWSIVRSSEEADLAVLATCVVVDKTERAMMKRLKELSNVPQLVVTGCMAAACREKAESVVPDAVFVRPADLGRIAEVVRADGTAVLESSVEGSSYGIVPIATGCLGSCSYCITKLARGVLRSRPQKMVVDTVRRMVSSGPREIRIAAQDTAAYGADIGSSLPALVEEISAIEGDFRFRIGMMNPRSVLPQVEAVALMYRRPKVFKFLHLPLQSASDSVLSEMERGYTVDEFKRIVSQVRSAHPTLSFSTDLIVGYPGETEDDHQQNKRAVSELAPDVVNVTKFSPRPGTKAAFSSHMVAGGEAKERSREITRIRFKVALDINMSWVGRNVNALATERGKDLTTLFRTDEYRQIVVPGEHPIGEFHPVKITGATSTYLRGKLGDVD